MIENIFIGLSLFTAGLIVALILSPFKKGFLIGFLIFFVLFIYFGYLAITAPTAQFEQLGRVLQLLLITALGISYIISYFIIKWIKKTRP